MLGATADMGGPGAEADRWDPVAFGTPAGDRVETWRTTPPKGFAQRLEEDLDGLWREAAERAAAVNGALIEAERVTVDGRPAFRRVERIPPGRSWGSGYVATLLVLLDEDTGLEVTVICPDQAGRSGPGSPPALTRARELIGRFTRTLRPTP